MRTKIRLPLVVALALTLAACATTQIQKARQVSIDVHASLATVQDLEAALYASGWPQWTPEKHRAFNVQLVIALKAGRALNEAVRYTPVSGEAKADLVTLSNALEAMTAIVVDALPPGHRLVAAITTAKDLVLSILPLILE